MSTEALEKSVIIEGFLSQLRPMLLKAVGEVVNKEEVKVVMATKPIPNADFHLSLILSVDDGATQQIASLIRSFEDSPGANVSEHEE
jgi:hypothetical protein